MRTYTLNTVLAFIAGNLLITKGAYLVGPTLGAAMGVPAIGATLALLWAATLLINACIVLYYIHNSCKWDDANTFKIEKEEEKDSEDDQPPFGGHPA